MSDEREYRRELRHYASGLILALLLTGAAFASVAFGGWTRMTTLAIIYPLALAQIVAHFRYFLHIDLARSKREDLQLILFSAVIAAIMVGGTLVILFNLKTRM